MKVLKVLIVVLLLSDVALAQTTSVASGTLAASALETAGYIAQGKMLGSGAFNLLLNNIAALIFLISIIMSILIVAQQGSFEIAKWLLIGPALFFFLIKPTTGGVKVEWRLGVFDDQGGELKKVLDSGGLQLNPNEKISSVFHLYNRLTTYLVQKTVNILTNKSARAQMLSGLRQEILAGAMSAQVEQPMLIALVNYTMNTCEAELSAARILAKGNKYEAYRRTPEYLTAGAKYCALMEQPDKPFPEGDVGEYIKDLDPNGKSDFFDDQHITCNRLWNYTYLGAAKEAERTVQVIELDKKPDQANKYVPTIEAEVYSGIVKRVTSSKLYDKTSGVEGRIKCIKDESITAPDDQALVPLLIAGWMLKKRIADDPRQGLIAQIQQHSGIEKSSLQYDNVESEEAKQANIRRSKENILGQPIKYENFQFAMMLPYLQGLGLFALSVLYPFFALTVIIPGMGQGIFIWMALWAWLKSWDIGWAFVMVADQVLWDLMPHSSSFRVIGNQGADGKGGTIETDPITMFEAAFEGDYSYTLTNYYMLLGIMINSVPMITAHAILGSKKVVAGVMTSGLKSLGANLSRAGSAYETVQTASKSEAMRELQQFEAGKRFMDNAHSAGMMKLNGVKMDDGLAANTAANPENMVNNFFSSIGQGFSDAPEFFSNTGNLANGTPSKPQANPTTAYSLANPNLNQGRNSLGSAVPELDAMFDAIGQQNDAGVGMRNSGNNKLNLAASAGLMGEVASKTLGLGKQLIKDPRLLVAAEILTLGPDGALVISKTQMATATAEATVGLQYQRNANSNFANLIDRAREYSYYEESKFGDIRNTNAEFSALTNRPAHFTAVGGPSNLKTQVVLDIMKIQRQSLGLDGKFQSMTETNRDEALLNSATKLIDQKRNFLKDYQK